MECKAQYSIDFSVILVNFNSADYVEHCLKWLEAQRFKGTMEIIAVNNCSTDGSWKLLKRHANVTLLNPGRNIGYSAANNLGIRVSRGRYVLCLNFDCLLTEDFLQTVYDAFEANPTVGMISGKMRKLVDMRSTMYLDSTGINFTSLVPADRGEWEYDVCQYDGQTRIFGPSGAAACYRREALDMAAWHGCEFFDEEMFTYCEDIDLAWRLNLAGWQGLYVPAAFALHERGATRRDSFWRKAGYFGNGFSNRYYTILKNLRWREDAKGRVRKLLRQEWRFLSSWCGKSIRRWLLAAYIFARLAWLLIQPGFFLRRRLAQKHGRGRLVALGLDRDFWSESYYSRRHEPLPEKWRAPQGSSTGFTRRGWGVNTGGFKELSWEEGGPLEGTTAGKEAYVELKVPKEPGGTARDLALYVEYDTPGDTTGHIEVLTPDGRRGKSDWFVIEGGRGKHLFKLGQMNLAAGATNAAAWQENWAGIRLYVSKGTQAAIRLKALDVIKYVKPVANALVNEAECKLLRNEVQSYPVLIYAEASTRCNLNCVMCGRAAYDVPQSQQGFMRKEAFDKLSELFHPGGRLALFGRGETLLHPDFAHLLRVAKENGMIVGFNSNGKALSGEIARAMVRYGQDSLTLSCSAGTPETYNAIHRGANWERLWENIGRLMREKQAHVQTKPAIYLEFVSQRRNIHELPLLVERAVERGLQGVIVIDLVAHSDELERERMNEPETAPVASRYYQQAREICRSRRHMHPTFELRLPSMYDARTKKIPYAKDEGAGETRCSFGEQSGSAGLCLEPWQTFYVRFDGTVAPCVITNRNLGDLNRQAAREIWNGPEFRKFRARMRSENKPFECLRCHLLPGPKRYDRALDNAETYAPL